MSDPNNQFTDGELLLLGSLRNAKGEITMKVKAVITISAVNPNAPPQYTGPSKIVDLVVGTGRALQGFDPDNDVITWSVDPTNAEQVSVSPEGILTALVPLKGAAITVWLDDGRG